MASVPTFARLSVPAILFRSALEIDYDGAPNAYHKGNAEGSADAGLDHICNGASVLQFNREKNRLVNKYGKDGEVGSLSGTDPKTGLSRSKLCKQDYIALRDKVFPPCSPSQECMIFYGVRVEPRACGYDNPFDGPSDQRCGLPILQTGPDGKERDFYLSTTSLRRRNTAADSIRQSDFVDASKIPFIVMPGGQKLPGDTPYDVGDIAVVVRGSQISYAVVGDTGPSAKIGEASPALLWQLNTKGPVDFDRPPATMTILFPGTRSLLKNEWPIDPNNVQREGRKLLDRVGIANLKHCSGLELLK